MQKKQKGILLVGILVFSSVALIVITGIVSWFTLTIRATRTVTEKELAFQIAEAGIDYYRWHLAHDPKDFRDGYVAGSPDTPEPIVFTDTIEIEAESVLDQSSFAPFTVLSDAQASGGEYVVWPNDGGDQLNSQTDPNLAGQGNYVFYLTDTADVEVEVRYLFPNGEDNSFFHVVDSEAWGTFEGTLGATWASGIVDQYTNLASGQHVFKILRREDGAQIDRITFRVTGGDGLLSSQVPPAPFVEPATSPQQDGLVMWLDASDINGDGTSTSDGVSVDDWEDKSPRNNDMENWGGRSRPEAATDDGLQAVLFENDHLRSDKNLYPVRPVTDTDIFAVVRVSDDAGGTFLDTKGTSVTIELPSASDSKLHWNFPDGSEDLEVDWTYPEDEYFLWNFQGSTTQGQSVRNEGVEVQSDGNSGGVSNPRKLFMGTLGSDGEEHDGMYVREVLIYDDTLTESERLETERYLRCKWVVGNQDDCVEVPDPDGGLQVGLPGETYGPFAHDFFDKNGIKIGEFNLMITAPDLGSTVVTVQSTGSLEKDPEVERTILSRLAIPSFAKYAFIANDTMRFGTGTVVRGPIHSNGGVRFDGTAYNVVTSALADYDDPDHSGANEFGVHTHVGTTDPTPPAAVPSRADVFVAGRDFPVPAVDFAGITVDLAEMKVLGQETHGVYLAASGGVGYRIDLLTDDTFDLYRVDSYRAAPSAGCYNLAGEDDWGIWSVGSDSFLANYPFPDNGIIFVEDHVWIEGEVDTAKLLVAAGRFPDTPASRRNIILGEDLTYTQYDGQDTIGLIAQGNIHVPLFSPDNLKVDAAMIAQNGRIGRNYYRLSGCGSTAVRDTIEIFGMIGSAKRYGFAWTDGTGYQNRLIDYDSELLYSPPPSFPLTSDAYETIWWEEVKVDDDFAIMGRGI